MPCFQAFYPELIDHLHFHLHRYQDISHYTLAAWRSLLSSTDETA